MKSIFGILLFSILSASVVQAEKLLSCNPPMGSRLQQVKFIQEGNVIYRSELDFSGSFSDPVRISAAAWLKKDLRWTSKSDGKVHLYQVQENGQTYWMYEADGDGIRVDGDCQE